MNILSFIVEIMATLVEAVIYADILRGLFNRRFQKIGARATFYITICLITFIILGMDYIELVSFNKPIFIVITIALTAFVFYDCGIIESISISNISLSWVLIFDFLVFSVINILFNLQIEDIIVPNTTKRLLWIVFAKFCYALSYHFIRKSFEFLHFTRKMYSYFFTISAVGLIGVIYMYTISIVNFEAHFFVTWVAFFVIVTIFFIFSIYSTAVIRQKNKDQVELEKLNKVKHSNNYNRKIYHDMNNHINIFYNLIKEGHIEKASEYIEAMKNVSKNPDDIKWTECQVINILLNDKYNYAKENNIIYDVNADFPEFSGITDFDMCVILSNLIDNAIEATIKLKDEAQKSIYIGIRKFNNVIVIKIENRYDKNLMDEKNKFLTTKKDKKNHGIGIESVKSIAEKYSGFLEYEFTDSLCTAQVTLFLQD